MTLARLRRVTAGVSFGKFRPALSITATTKTTSAGRFPAVLIGVNVKDSQANDSKTIRLYECYIAPLDLDDVALALWVRDRCQDLLLHEMDEFFRFNGEVIAKPVHPVTKDTFSHVRKRNDS